ncbi:MAG: cyclic nucleotide-binding domain-containing protein [Deltaproteobacteria bacterium]|nr:cyclic nucleotide-binding domain-containing protein [Deltaproteobacteria bacterium]
MAAGESSGAGIELFRGLSASQIAPFRPLGRPVRLSRGSSLFQLGDDALTLYIVRSGRIAFTMPIDVQGTPQDALVDEKGPGSVVGWSALAPPHRYTLSAHALEDSELTSFLGTELRAQIVLDPAAGIVVLLNLVELLGHRAQQTQAMWLRELQRTLDTRLG